MTRILGDRRRRRRFLGAAALGGGALLTLSALLGPNAQATPISNNGTVQDTDWVSASVGGIGTVGGTISLSGVSGPVTQARLYWHGIDTPASGGNGTYDAANVTINGVPVMGTSLGDATTNCWGAGSGRAYVADVTPLVTGNGTYNLANVAGPGEDANGATLVVFFDDGDDTNNRDVVLFGGNDSNWPEGFPGEDEGWHGTLAGIDYSGGSASLVLHVADGQDFGDDGVTVGGGAGTLVFPDSNALFDGNSVPNAGHSREGTALWDQHAFDVTGVLAPGANTMTIDSGVTHDCLALVLAAVDLPAGAAPPDEVCDGADNDGDGVVDETFPDTDSDGQANCVDTDDDGDTYSDTEETDAGSDPLDPNSTPERCDGADNDLDGSTDEGSPDSDNDGIADCVDNDRDNDGVPDADDNCPDTPNTDQADADADGIGDACDPVDDSAPCKVTGGGAIAGKRTFGFNASDDPLNPATGNLVYQDRVGDLRLKSVVIDSVRCTETTARFTGQGTVRNTVVDFTVEVADNGEPGTNDTFSISWTGYSASGNLESGNIQIH